MARGSYEVEEKLAKATPLDLARLAAFIDGEGSIGISITKPAGAHRSRRHNLSLIVSNTSVLLMSWLKEVFGGSVYTSTWEDGAKSIHRWQLNHRQAAAVLEACLPYFIIKKGQAEAGIAFKKTKWANSWQGRTQVPESVLEERDLFAETIKNLNKENTVSSAARRLVTH